MKWKHILGLAVLVSAMVGCTSVDRSTKVGIAGNEARVSITSNESVEGALVAAIRDGEESPDGEIFCRSSRVTGTRKSRRVCHSREEWVAMRRNGEEAMRVTQQKATMHFENEQCGRLGNSC